MADALASGASVLRDVGVQVPLRPPGAVLRTAAPEVTNSEEFVTSGFFSFRVHRGGCSEGGVGLDLQFDSTIDGKALKVASAVDEQTKQSVLNIVDRSIDAPRLVRELERTLHRRGRAARCLRARHRPVVHLPGSQGFCDGRVGLDYIPPVAYGSPDHRAACELSTRFWHLAATQKAAIFRAPRPALGRFADRASRLPCDHSCRTRTDAIARDDAAPRNAS